MPDLIQRGWLKRGEAARYVNMSVRTIDDWKNSGLLKYSKLPGGTVLFKISDLDQFLESFAVPAKEKSAERIVMEMTGEAN